MDHNGFDFQQIAESIRQKAMTIDDEQIRKMEAEEAEDRRANSLAVLAQWDVPRRAIDALRAPRETRLLDTVRHWAERGDEAWCLLLSSSPGLGKSVAAAWWLGDKADGLRPGHMGSFPLWWPASKLARVDSYDGTLDRIAKGGVLVIDDLGVEFNDTKGNFRSRLDELLDARYANYRRTIITTNLNAGEFKARYGERIVDRIREAGGDAFHEFKGQSLRGVANG